MFDSPGWSREGRPLNLITPQSRVHCGSLITDQEPSIRPVLSKGVTTRVLVAATTAEPPVTAAHAATSDAARTATSTAGCGQASPVAVGPSIQEGGPGAAGAAVCWAQPGRRDVFCGDDPSQPSVRELYSAEPVDQVQAPVDPQPWGVELMDGSRCTLLTSGAWAPGQDVTSPAYACTKDAQDSELYVLATDAQPINRSAAVWTAKVGQIGNTPGSLPAATTVPPSVRRASPAERNVPLTTAPQPRSASAVDQIETGVHRVTG